MPGSNLTVAATGPTGRFGLGLLPLLQRDERIGRDVLTGAEVLREFGLTSPPAPAGLVRAVAGGDGAVPFTPAVAGRAEAISRPAIMERSGWHD